MHQKMVNLRDVSFRHRLESGEVRPKLEGIRRSVKVGVETFERLKYTSLSDAR